MSNNGKGIIDQTSCFGIQHGFVHSHISTSNMRVVFSFIFWSQLTNDCGWLFSAYGLANANRFIWKIISCRNLPIGTHIEWMQARDRRTKMYLHHMRSVALGCRATVWIQSVAYVHCQSDIYWIGGPGQLYVLFSLALWYTIRRLPSISAAVFGKKTRLVICIFDIIVNQHNARLCKSLTNTWWERKKRTRKDIKLNLIYTNQMVWIAMIVKNKPFCHSLFSQLHLHLPQQISNPFQFIRTALFSCYPNHYA